jgi:hypothetical protein
MKIPLLYLSPLTACGVFLKTTVTAERWWLTPVILATQEAEIRRITVQSQTRQRVHETLSRKNHHKKGWGSG